MGSEKASGRKQHFSEATITCSNFNCEEIEPSDKMSGFECNMIRLTRTITTAGIQIEGRKADRIERNCKDDMNESDHAVATS
jgi:hypothetical protein